jgi:hypothetical protein
VRVCLGERKEGMDYVGVAEEEGGEPVEIPIEEDGTGGHENGTRGEVGTNVGGCQHVSFALVS